MAQSEAASSSSATATCCLCSGVNTVLAAAILAETEGIGAFTADQVANLAVNQNKCSRYKGFQSDG